MTSSDSQDHFRAIQNLVRDRLATGALPPSTSGSSVVSRGRGQQCVVCDASVDSEQVAREVEVWGGSAVTVHVACYWLWHVETLRLVADRLPDR